MIIRPDQTGRPALRDTSLSEGVTKQSVHSNIVNLMEMKRASWPLSSALYRPNPYYPVQYQKRVQGFPRRPLKSFYEKKSYRIPACRTEQ